MNKKILTVLLVILVIIILISLFIYIKKNKNKEIEYSENADTEEIENEKYYKENEKKLENLDEKYEKILTKYINAMFSEEEKNVLKEYDNKMTEAVLNGDIDAKKKASNEKTDYVEKISKEKFSEKQKNKLAEIQNKINKLKPIEDEYIDKKTVLEEKNFWKDRETLADGSITNVRENVISDKVCNGLQFTNISLIYNPETNNTNFAAKVTNISDVPKEGKVSVKITGDVECMFPINIERLEPGEYYEFTIENSNNISMAKKLEIIEYNEKDYLNI